MGQSSISVLLLERGMGERESPCASCEAHLELLIQQFDALLRALEADREMGPAAADAVAELLERIQCRLGPETFFDEPRDGEGATPRCVAHDFGPVIIRALQPMIMAPGPAHVDEWVDALASGRVELRRNLTALRGGARLESGPERPGASPFPIP